MKPKRPKHQKIKWYKREFLNPNSGTAFVESSFNYDSVNAWASGSFKVADCNQSIVLDFDCHLRSNTHSKNASLNARLKKIDILINHLTKTREAMLLAAERHPVDAAEWKKYHAEMEAYNKANGIKLPNLIEIDEHE